MLNASCCEHSMKRKYVTGWFSPADPDVMVVFYELRESRTFEADVMKAGGVVQTLSDTDLGRLQSDAINRCGGAPVRRTVDLAQKAGRDTHARFWNPFRSRREFSPVDRLS